MKVRHARKTDVAKCLNIAKDLKEWFTKEAVSNMKIDFNINRLLVSEENIEIIGFHCYSSFNGFLQIKWMGVKKKMQNKGIGSLLLKSAEKEAKLLGLRKIEADTLKDDSYKPYQVTKTFYYNKGFKKVGSIKVSGWDDQIIMEKVIK